MTSTKYLTQITEEGKNKLILNKYSNQNQQTNDECLMCWAPPMIDLFLHELISYISSLLNYKIVFMLIKNMKIGKKMAASLSKLNLFSSISKGWNFKNWDYLNRKKESLKTNSKHIRSQRKIKEKQQEERWPCNAEVGKMGPGEA